MLCEVVRNYFFVCLYFIRTIYRLPFAVSSGGIVRCSPVFVNRNCILRPNFPVSSPLKVAWIYQLTKFLKYNLWGVWMNSKQHGGKKVCTSNTCDCIYLMHWHTACLDRWACESGIWAVENCPNFPDHFVPNVAYQHQNWCAVQLNSEWKFIG